MEEVFTSGGELDVALTFYDRSLGTKIRVNDNQGY